MSAPQAQGTQAGHSASSADSKAQLAAWFSPICIDLPAGADTTYHHAQLAIRSELDKLQSLTGQLPDWSFVLAESDRLLRSETKDLSLASFLTVALFERHGLSGLALGLRAITGIAERFWDSCWPPRARIKQRANVLRWVIEHVRMSSSARVWTRADREALAPLDGALRDFAQHMQGCFGPATLDVEPLSLLVARLRAGAVAAADVSPNAPPQAAPERASASPATLPVLTAERAPTDEPSATALASASEHARKPPATAPVPSLESKSERVSAAQPGDGLSQLRALAGSVIELAEARFKVDRSDPLAYQWLRRGLWLACDRAPAAGVRGRTEISPPNRKLQQGLHLSMREQHWEAALEQAEHLCRHNPFWLEGHWISASALEKLGEPYRAAKASVELEVRAFVQRVPRLCTLQFSDGSPVCPPSVSSWLTATGASGPAARNVDLQKGAVVLDDDERRGLVQDEPDTLAKLRLRLGAARDGRTRFLLTFELARTLQAAGRNERALMLYLALERELEERGLWSWEPECCTQILRATVTLMATRSPHGMTGSDDGEMRRLRVRLAQLDPTLF